MDQISKVIEPGRQFGKDSMRLVKRCTKPDRKGNIAYIYYSYSFFMHISNCLILLVFVQIEFQKIAVATAIGFSIMGFIGFFVKLIHIPINNIIV